MRGQPGDGHIQIGREVLALNGVLPKDLLDVYIQMFKLKYARVVEHPDRLLEVEFKGRLTPAQERYVEGMRAAGWKVKFVKVDGHRLAPAAVRQPVS